MFVILLAVAPLLLLAACSSSGDLEDRVTALEQELVAMEQQLASRPALGNLIVIGKEVNTVSTRKART